MTRAAEILDVALDALGTRVGFTVDGRPVDLRRVVVAANAVRRREGLPEVAYPGAVAPARESAA